jgi:ABC-type transport system substrate-binding protein
MNTDQTLQEIFLLLLDHAQSCTFIVTAVARLCEEEGDGMKVRVAATIAVAMSALLAAGCSATTAAPQGAGSAAATIPPLRIGDDAALSTLETGADEGNDVYGTLETLTKFGPAGQVEPSLASSVSHPDAVTYVYHVRQGVKFWNGDPMTDIIAALGNNAQPVTTLIPPAELDRLGPQAQVSALINALPSYPYDLAKAKQELAESAYPHGFTATTQTITFASYTPVNEAVAGDLAKIGINLQFKTIGFTQYLAFASGNKNAIGGLYATMNVTNPDPDSFPSALLGSVNIADGGYDWANYDPPVIDTLIKAGETTQDSARRLAIYGQMLKTLATDLPYVPLYIQDYNVALSSNFTWPNYNVYTQWGDWELHIKPKN